MEFLYIFLHPRRRSIDFHPDLLRVSEAVSYHQVQPTADRNQSILSVRVHLTDESQISQTIFRFFQNQNLHSDIARKYLFRFLSYLRYFSPEALSEMDADEMTPLNTVYGVPRDPPRLSKTSGSVSRSC